MSGLITPRRGASIARFAVDNYSAYYVGLYRGLRDAYLIAARQNVDRRDIYCQSATHNHREMMRCLREYRREQRMQVAA